MMGDGGRMIRRHALHVAAVLWVGGLIGCGPDATRARPGDTLRVVPSVPPVPEEIAGQRVRYVSANLLPGDTSFELPVGGYGVEFVEGDGSRDPNRPASRCWRGATTLAVHGRRALRFSPPAVPGSYGIRCRATPVKPGQVYTFSAYLRGGGGPASVRLVPRWPVDRQGEKAFQLTNRWRRCQVSFQAPAGQGSVQSVSVCPLLVVSSDGPGRNSVGGGAQWVDVDAVQLEPGRMAGPYRPRRPVEYAAVVNPASTVLAGPPSTGRLDSSPRALIACAVRNNTAARIRLQLVWQLSNILNGSRRVRVLATTLSPGGGRDLKLDFGPGDVGYYLLRTDVRGGVDVGLTERLEVPVLGRSAPGDLGRYPFFGLAEASVGSWNAAQVSSTSRPVVSVFGMCPPQRVNWRWRDLETTPGVDDLRAVDGVINAMLEGGAEPVVCPSGPMADVAPTWAVRSGGPDAPAVDARQYRQFIFRLVSHFHARVRYWHLPSAPRDQGLAWAKLFRQAVKLADPHAKVVGPGFGPSQPPPPSRIQAFLAAGGAAELDVLLHGVWTDGVEHPRDDWDRLDRDLAMLARACASRGRPDLPRWAITPAWGSSDSADLAARAIQVHQAALLLKKHGVTHWLIPTPLPSGSAVGSVRCVEAAACGTVARWLASATFERERAVSPDLIVMVFDTATGPIAALVCTKAPRDARPVTVSLAARLHAEDLFGRTLADGAAPIDLTLSPAPIYVRPLGEQANWLDGIVVSPTGRAR